MKYIPIVFFLSFFLYNCHIQHDNNEVDKKEAEAVAEKFYYFQEIGDLKGIDKLISKEVQKEIDIKVLHELIIGTYQNFGGVRNFELDFWETSVLDGPQSKGRYKLQYYVTRESKHTFETLELIRESDSIKISSYVVKRDEY